MAARAEQPLKGSAHRVGYRDSRVPWVVRAANNMWTMDNGRKNVIRPRDDRGGSACECAAVPYRAVLYCMGRAGLRGGQSLAAAFAIARARCRSDDRDDLQIRGRVVAGRADGESGGWSSWRAFWMRSLFS